MLEESNSLDKIKTAGQLKNKDENKKDAPIEHP
jgi:hypothetical protein